MLFAITHLTSFILMMYKKIKTKLDINTAYFLSEEQ